jgi:hypothetical protein
MICDESSIEDIQSRLNNTITFTGSGKKNLKKSTTKWCNDCNTDYKIACSKVSLSARKYKLGNYTDTYLKDVDSLKDKCISMADEINKLPLNI